MSPLILLFLLDLLCCILVIAKTRVIKDEKDKLSSPLLCGSEVLIKHRSSDLCLTMTNNQNNPHLKQIELQQCYEFDTNQRWKLHCCDPYLLRCGRYNPFLDEGDEITYSDYFQIQQRESKLCISTANIWKRGNEQEPKSVYLQQCQPSLLDSMDSVQSIKIQRDKFLFNDGEDDSRTPVHTDHFTFLINLFVPLCLGQESGPKVSISINTKPILPPTDKLLRGYTCNVHRENSGSIQFKFIPLVPIQNNDAQFDEL